MGYDISIDRTGQEQAAATRDKKSLDLNIMERQNEEFETDGRHENH
jgi:hypothetical protein